MCDPFTLLLGAISLGGSLLSSTQKPPAPQIPATSAGPPRAGGATVRIGTKEDTTTPEAVPDSPTFIEKRSSGKALSGLGRSGLAL